ncbi:5-bromo-4-chloroindolyl phosphate hydrolysis family protein [Clostridium beijerinckii]|jgi:5-bromo-4-chloroindolyl phosphate hydrolysis protein|uniref:5-bromo-4-chloroindolyl phosphate hydrolysis protein n=2 Tax=Clostridium beijerinckii TaxID=1520 RepID=A0AAW3W7U5_CLOBE|nr:5-bromo-4-chloroindolyl phosphate hydrolysis family protein [Clostridium beijerinckii]MBC2457805.1 5-bromo-4-chloroindolyl phosphate hydrolysis protein [Clostridium beijerinckii]MBC2474751.1 5-bromo-4-chloroindolyl phosphate hydrolysis protein [Clostridium beijerinckii]MDG5856547.1 5-bromo-4-chloroindolyl phosphate hydrolysis family protein [Clostridium beijerinckii]NOV58249.1 5-bromo-4-chloroindolyl phosphate hydrolysis protein [Clostridium beijerinckii]NOV69489.1 5-bromo-4-chloroindolyl p
MDKKDFSNLEKQIRDTIKNAFDVIDFAKIKKDIDDKAQETVRETRNKFVDKSQYFDKKIKDELKNRYKNIANVVPKSEDKIQKYIAKRPVGSISGTLYTIFGSILSGILGILIISYSILISFKSEFLMSNLISLGILFSFLAASGAFTLRGINLRKRAKRFKEYVKLLRGNSYCSISELAEAVRKKNKFVVKDLRKMIELNMFPQGHIDDKQTYFMLNNEVYENYLTSQESLKKRNEDELKKQEELKKDFNDPVKMELRNTIEMGRDYIKQIGDISSSIDKEEISKKLNRLQNIINQILKYVEQNPKKLQEVDRFAKHYLPMTLKLLNAYKELNEQPVQGDNIRNAKNEIEKTLDTINNAFEKLLDDLFEEIALDISTDISVLETLFTQEGLKKDDFKK